jgi:CheY-like chemotaxis protein
MHVLVVDDNLLSRTRIVSQVRRAGWEVTAVAADPEVLARFRHHHPDTVIVNLAADRPAPPLGPSGGSRAAAFVRALRNAPSWTGVPVLGFCGHADQVRRQEGLTAGCTKVATNASVAADITDLIRALTAPGADQGGHLVT